MGEQNQHETRQPLPPRPAVEITPQEDEESGPTSPLMALAVAVVAGVASFLLAATSFWQDEIAGRAVRGRYSGALRLVQNMGQTTWVIILAAVAAIAIMLAIRSLVILRREATPTDSDATN